MLSRSRGMGPREEDNSILLFSATLFVCGLVALVPWMFEPTPAQAAKMSLQTVGQPIASESSASPVRVIVPFTPNTTPSAR